MQSDDHPTLCNGRYRLMEILGEGGMAVVYRAMDEHLRVERAVKLLVPAATRLPEARARLETEARAMASLAHPNVVAVFDIRRDGAELYLVMELITGGTLWDWVRSYGPMPPRMVLQVLIPVLDAVQAAHEAGVIHRDLKPHNIMLEASGKPKVADFGIAHVAAPLAGTSYTRTGTVLGTWAFMAPEQRHSARDVDERTDIYALGATAYSLLTGEPPFDLFAADQDARLLAGIPPALADLIRKATRYNPADRYPSAASMSEAAAEILPDLEPVPTDLPQLGTAPTVTHDVGLDTAALTSESGPLQTAGPAADLLYGRRRLHSAPFTDEHADASPELSLYWKLLATVGPALIAAAAGGAVMLTRAEPPASLRLDGDAMEVNLIDPEGQAHVPGTLPPGLYRVQARFGDGEDTVDAGELQLESGSDLTLICVSETRRCAARASEEEGG